MRLPVFLAFATAVAVTLPAHADMPRQETVKDDPSLLSRFEGTRPDGVPVHVAVYVVAPTDGKSSGAPRPSRKRWRPTTRSIRNA